jgi:hypothetical protein
LRVLCLEQPERARALLETFPQLRRAVCLILQKEGKLSIPLPPEAFITPEQERKKREAEAAAAKKKKQNNNNHDDDDDGTHHQQQNNNNEDAAMMIIDEEEQEKIQQLLSEISPEDLEKLLVADFENDTELEDSAKQQLMKLQRQLRAMGAE